MLITTLLRGLQHVGYFCKDNKNKLRAQKKNISRLSARYRTSSTEPMTFWYDRGLYMVE